MNRVNEKIYSLTEKIHSENEYLFGLKQRQKKSLNIICSKYSSHHLGQSEIIEVLQLTIQANLYIFNFAFEIS